MEVKEIRWHKATKMLSYSQWLAKANSDDAYRAWRQVGPFRTEYWIESQRESRAAAYVEPPHYLDLVELAFVLLEYHPLTSEGNHDHHNP